MADFLSSEQLADYIRRISKGQNSYMTPLSEQDLAERAEALDMGQKQIEAAKAQHQLYINSLPSPGSVEPEVDRD